jgi:hypothetical protein
LITLDVSRTGEQGAGPASGLRRVDGQAPDIRAPCTTRGAWKTLAYGPGQFDTHAPMDRVLKPGEQLIVSGTADVLRDLRAEV